MNTVSHYFHDLRGERKDQMLITVDKSGKITGQATREECHKCEGKTHLAFMAILIGKKGKIILTRRSSQKSLWSGIWDVTVVSHILAGETPESAAHRRGKEEMGVEAKFRDLGAFYYFAEHGESCENEYCHVLVGKTNDELHPNPVEISEMEEITFDELCSDINKNKNKYTPWLRLALDNIDICRHFKKTT